MKKEICIILLCYLLSLDVCQAQTAGKGSGGKSSSGSRGRSSRRSSGGFLDGIAEFLIQLLVETLIRIFWWLIRQIVYLCWCYPLTSGIIAICAYGCYRCINALESFNRESKSMGRSKSRQKARWKKKSTPKSNSSRRGPPSGKWSGFYQEFGQDFSMWEIELRFSNGDIKGNGADGLGKFQIEGYYALSKMEFQFTKSYVGKHQHDIQCEGIISRNYAEGLRGIWHNSDNHGQFGYWPIMSDWLPNNQMGISAAKSKKVYNVTEDNKCIVCFDNEIDCVLRPCGHIAACSKCVSHLQSKQCPICRTEITLLNSTRCSGESIQVF